MRLISVLLALCECFASCHSLMADARDQQPDLAIASSQSWPDTIARWISPKVRKHEADQRLRISDLNRLPEYTTQADLRAGFHSGLVPVPGPPEWVQVDLGREYSIDAIAIVPAIISIRGGKEEQYGFPEKLLVQISNSADFSDFEAEQIVLRKTDERFSLYPVVYRPKKTSGRYVRLTSLKHAEQNGMGYFALGELIVLSGELNVAAWRRVTASSQVDTVLRWAPRYLVDQFSMLPPAMGTRLGTSRGFLSAPSESDYSDKWVVIDLEREYPIDEVRIYPARAKDNTHVPGWGMPLSFRVEISKNSEFANSELIVDFSGIELRHWSDAPLICPLAARAVFNAKRLSDGKPLFPDPQRMVPIPARYVRIYANRLDSRISPTFMALGEVQVYARGKNVAKNATVIVSDQASPEYGARWDPAFMVDGFSGQRNLTELSQWLRMIERREQIDIDFSKTEQELDLYRHRVVNVAGSTLGVGFLVAITSLLVVNWRQKRVMRVETEDLRSQIASDLHDDIGSNLGTIALISEMLETNPELSGSARADLREIQTIAMETSGAMRDIVWILQPSNVTLSDFVVRLRSVANRMLPGSELTFDAIECRSSLPLGIRWRRNVFLAIKEVVHNIAKHSQAKRTSIQIERSETQLIFRIVDDGIGFDVASCIQGYGVDNVQKRMEDLGGNVKYFSEKGTRVVLRIPLPASKDGKPKPPKPLHYD